MERRLVVERESSDHADLDVALDSAWRNHRRHLLDVAFRILGNLADAEDAVQETFTRLTLTDIDQIDDVRGWLVVVVSRVCLDRLRAERRRPTTPDEFVGEAATAPDTDPAERVTLDDSVRIALHVMVERLTPPERTAFILHDVFGYSFNAVSDIVGRSPTACRQLASRARRVVAGEAARSRFAVESAEQRRLTEQFMTACATGDLAGLLAVLDPAVAGDGELGGGRTRVAVGRDNVGPLLLLFLGPDANTTLVSLHTGDEANIVALRDGRVVTLLTLTISGEMVCHVHALADPAALAPIADVLGGRSV